MTKSARIRLPEIRALFQLTGECRELGDDPVLWRRHMLAGLARLTGAGLAINYEGIWLPTRVSGIVEWGWENGFDRRPWLRMNEEFARTGADVNPMVRPYLTVCRRGGHPSQTRADLVRDGDWYRSRFYREYQEPSGGDTILFCDVPLPAGDGSRSILVLVLPVGAGDFTARDRAVVQELHAAITPLIGGPLAGLDEPSPANLSPRSRQVLRCLLDGDGDKQVAGRLAISPLTVNVHTKAIYKHFGVSSRAELLARWVRRGWGLGQW
jgi:DNA-binding CsgD family transcriptional regulator